MLPGAKITAFYTHRKHKYLFCNTIDLDARAHPKANFTLPDAIKEVSLNEIYKDALRPLEYNTADKVAHYLLVSKAGAITLWHTDFSYTSVLYIVVKGTKVFHVVQPTENNKKLWAIYLEKKKRNLYFGTHPDLDLTGSCKVIVIEGQAICMPAGVMHCVHTIGVSVAFGK